MSAGAATTVLCVAAAAALATACDDGTTTTTAAEPVVRDSAGVTIVENVEPAWAAGGAWTLSPEPVLEIGMMDGPEAYQLFRVWDARRLSDGRIAVVDGGSNELRFYDADGRFLSAVGGTGGGPGEFRTLSVLWELPGDSILAYDFAPPRLSVGTSAGELVRSFAVPSPDGRQVLVRGVLSDGSLIVQGAPIWDADGATEGLVRDPVPYYRYGSEGEILDTIGRFPSSDVFRAVTAEGIRLTNPPYPRIPAMAVVGDRFYFAAADSYEIDVRWGAGRLERRIRLARRGEPVTAAHIAAFRAEREALAEQAGGRPGAIAALLADLPIPETMPPHGHSLEVDAAGNIWLVDYAASPEDTPLWRVFTSDGAYLGPVAFPPGLTPLHIGEDFVLARWSDDLEVEYVRTYDLIKPETR